MIARSTRKRLSGRKVRTSICPSPDEQKWQWVTPTIVVVIRQSGKWHRDNTNQREALVKGEKCMEVLVLDQSYYTPHKAIHGSAKPYLMQEQRFPTQSGFEKFARWNSAVMYYQDK